MTVKPTNLNNDKTATTKGARKQTTSTNTSGKLDNIRQLSAINQKDGDYSILLGNIQSAISKVDDVLRSNFNKQQVVENQDDKLVKTQVKKEQQELKPAVKVNPVDVSNDNIPLIEKGKNKKADAITDKKTVDYPIKDDAVKSTVKVSSVDSTVSINTVDKLSKDKNRIQSTSSQNKKPSTTHEVKKNETFKVEQKSDNTPSYIRGKMTPAQQQAITRSREFDRNKTVNPQNRQGFQGQNTGAPRQFNNYNNPNGGYNNRQNNPNGFAPRPNQGGFNNARPGQPRPAGTGQGGFNRKPAVTRAEPVVAPKEKKFDTRKKDHSKPMEEKKAMSKRTLIRKGFIQENMSDDRVGYRKLKNKKQKDQIMFMPQKIEKAIITTENLTVKILSEKIGKTAQEIIKQLMVLGIMTTINSVVDFATMELVANEFGVELELKLEQTKEEQLESLFDSDDIDKDLIKRPPVITVMGHVDHGKTSLLDALRKTSVVTGESGGITQHIGAYSVVCKGQRITFLDTPGHEAFTEMRARGAKVTDIAVLVVAADDGVMPQTIEAVNHAKAANVPILVAINKIDKPTANIDKIKQLLADENVVCEEWGGDTIMVPISAKKGTNLDKLLESILLLSEVNDYKANPNRKAKGSIIEAKLDKGKGPVANIIVQNGTLRVGDFVVSGVASGRVRAMVDDKGKLIKEALPSTPISVLGFTSVPNAGDTLFAVENEKMAKQVVAERAAKIKSDQLATSQMVTLDDVFTKIDESQIKDLNIIIKADVQGSVEALKNSLAKLRNDEVKVNVVHGGVGAINKSDLMLADVSKAILVGFNVKPDSESKIIAENTGVDIRQYKVIYEAIEDITNVMNGMLTPKTQEVITGRAEVRNVFKVTNSGVIAGSYVLSGKIYRNGFVRIFRGDEIVHQGQINGLKRFKEDVKEIAEGYECGISIKDFVAIKELDQIECYIEEIVK